MPGVISWAIPNRNDQHVRSWGWEQERDEGWFFHSRGVSTGNVGAGVWLGEGPSSGMWGSVRQIWGRWNGRGRLGDWKGLWAGEIQKEKSQVHAKCPKCSGLIDIIHDLISSPS